MLRPIHILYLAALAIAVLLIGASIGPGNAAENETCAPHSDVVAFLKERHAEQQQNIGVTNGGAVVEVYVSETGSWTLIVSALDGERTCIIAAGVGWKYREFPVAEAPKVGS